MDLAILPAFFSERANASNIDQLVSKLVNKFPGEDPEKIADFCVALERSLLMDFKPTSTLDFQHELEKQYHVLQELSKEVQSSLSLLSEDLTSPEYLQSVKPMLDVLRVAKDYLKLILEAQKEFYNVKIMQNFMDTVLNVIGEESKEMKQRILERLSNV